MPRANHSENMLYVQKLVEEIDRQFSGYDARRLVNSMADWTPQRWAELALLAAVTPPSVELIAEVISVFVRRALAHLVPGRGTQERRAS